MTSAQRWLETNWPFVRGELPQPPARVIEIGCGPLGGFVPMMRADGYRAVGVDPDAPEGDAYVRTEFETYPHGPADAVVACMSLHHVSNLGAALDRVSSVLVDGATLIVIEWASEEFDLATAQWCFERLREPSDEHDGWLNRHRDRWRAAGVDWETYLAAWLADEGPHAGSAIVAELDARFDQRACAHGPYFFADLADTTPADEQAAIDAGRIRANGIRHVSTRRARR